MTKITENAEQVLREQYESYVDAETTSFEEYVRMCAESDPNFYRWFFGESFNNDFDADLTEEHRELFDEFVNSFGEVNKNTLISFAEKEDYAYLYGAGLMVANDTKEKASIATLIAESSIIEEVTGDISELPCSELADEQKNGCTIYKCYNSNEEALYIAYFK